MERITVRRLRHQGDHTSSSMHTDKQLQPSHPKPFKKHHETPGSCSWLGTGKKRESELGFAARRTQLDVETSPSPNIQSTHAALSVRSRQQRNKKQNGETKERDGMPSGSRIKLRSPAASASPAPTPRRLEIKKTMKVKLLRLPLKEAGGELGQKDIINLSTARGERGATGVPVPAVSALVPSGSKHVAGQAKEAKCDAGGVLPGPGNPVKDVAHLTAAPAPSVSLAISLRSRLQLRPPARPRCLSATQTAGADRPWEYTHHEYSNPASGRAVAKVDSHVPTVAHGNFVCSSAPLPFEKGHWANSLLSAGVLQKEQVKSYPLHLFYSVYLTPHGARGAVDGPLEVGGSIRCLASRCHLKIHHPKIPWSPYLKTANMPGPYQIHQSTGVEQNPD
ncbi:hypothetical protein DNTS_001533 [Danionella cerebrum]|uniref:Uncharacterized protein n=1 Tax=Danionella cerebrum TaxID=2873325 RepID=A0A553PYY1_9TELE|nr:hypothetical protein DNTS_001533 [Danionella translucida]